MIEVIVCDVVVDCFTLRRVSNVFTPRFFGGGAECDIREQISDFSSDLTETF